MSDTNASPNRVLAVMCAGMFLVLLDVTIVNVALPQIGVGLQAGVAVLPLAVPLVVLAPLSGRLTAARGPRTAVTVGCLIAMVDRLPILAVAAEAGLVWPLVAMGVLGCGAGLVTARQIGTASGVAVFGAIAGSPHATAHFVGRLHLIAVVAAALWVIAAVVAFTGIDGRRSLAV